MKKKRKRIKVKVFILLLCVLAIIIGLYFKQKNNNMYSKEAYSIINKTKELKYLLKKNYSKTIDEALKSNNYQLEHINDYLDIVYLDQDNFIVDINNYLNKGYTGKEINKIFKLSNTNQKALKEVEKINIEKYYKIKNFNVNNYQRYEDYASSHNYSIEDVVTYVNINLDKEFYTDTLETQDADNLLVLVNKYNHLPNNYKPTDLVYVSGAYGNEVPLREVIKKDFIALQNAAKKEIHINLMPTTAFRDQNFQNTLYSKYVAEDGVKAADTYSARPGYSEHQTGLAIDLKNIELTDKRLTDDNYKWLKENAYKYGFIIRFPQDKEFITGYQFENWHIRYVGKEVAKIIHENNLTLEEYIDLYIKEY